MKNHVETDLSNASVVRLKTPFLTNHEIVSGIKLGDPKAAEALVDRFGVSIDRRVWRLLGADSEHHDVVQQVYAQILGSIKNLREADALVDWITKVTVNIVRNELRRRKYRRIVKFDDVPAQKLVEVSDPEDRLRVLRGFKIMETMKVNERIAFTMRFIEGAELTDVAGAMGCSLSTAKRRIKRARDNFLKKAKRDPLLSSLIKEGAGDER
ncbi:MAG: sigma-70 family RNA polymerase sigma factor [Deltaproteobacteria bacterium]|nr:sigma-70 family RNA polymerase sigma factor [Deltaproteobacteria bacterium]